MEESNLMENIPDNTDMNTVDSSLITQITENPTIMLSIGIALLFAIVLFAIFFRQSSSPKEGLSGRYPAILIYGPVNSGKTLLFYKLYSGQFQKTQTSMTENILEFKPNGMNKIRKTYQFIDFPGHGSKQSQIYKYIKKYNNKGLKGLIFVVDCSNQASIIDGSKMLYGLLDKQVFLKQNPKILILLNKKDELPSEKIDTIESYVKTIMLNEFTKLRDSFSTLKSIDEGNDENQTIVLGEKDKPLTWKDLSYKFAWTLTSLSDGGEQSLDDVESFLAKL